MKTYATSVTYTRADGSTSSEQPKSEKQPHDPPHAPECACGWALPRMFDPAEWAPYDAASVVVVCPGCGEWYTYHAPIVWMADIEAEEKAEATRIRAIEDEEREKVREALSRAVKP